MTKLQSRLVNIFRNFIIFVILVCLVPVAASVELRRLVSESLMGNFPKTPLWPFLGVVLGWFIGYIPLALGYGLLPTLACIPLGLFIAYKFDRWLNS